MPHQTISLPGRIRSRIVGHVNTPRRHDQRPGPLHHRWPSPPPLALSTTAGPLHHRWPSPPPLALSTTAGPLHHRWTSLAQPALADEQLRRHPLARYASESAMASRSCLAAASLAGADLGDTRATSGLFNVMQQVGGILGLAATLVIAAARCQGADLRVTSQPIPTAGELRRVGFPVIHRLAPADDRVRASGLAGPASRGYGPCGTGCYAHSLYQRRCRTRV
jgi:hypothetical protein